MMDLLESMHATQSTSAKALICKEDLDGKNNPCHRFLWGCLGLDIDSIYAQSKWYLV